MSETTTPGSVSSRSPASATAEAVDEAQSSGYAPTPRKPRQRIVRVLVVLASLLAFLSVIGIWLERQALNTDDWVATSDQFLQNDTIRGTVANYLVDQLYANVSVKREIASALPDQVHGLAGPASAGLRQVAGDGADEVLQTSAAQDLWSTANQNAHEQLLVVLHGGNGVVSTRSGTVTLNLGQLVASLVSQLGIGGDVHLPATVGQVTILHSDQLGTAQQIANSISGVALLLVLLTFAALALAIYLSAPEDRWMTMLYCGIGLIAAGFAVIVARHVSGQIIVGDLVTDDSVKPAGDAAWSIATSLMVSIAITVMVLGGLFGLAGWLGSPASSARSTRGFLAPGLERHVGYFYGGLGVLLGLYFLAAPTHGLRSFLTTIVLGALAAVGIRHLRRQAVAEFSGRQGAGAEPLTRVRQRVLSIGRSIGSSASQIRVPERRAEPERQRADSRPDQATRIEHLERLSALHDKGILSSEELAAEKAEVLGSPPSGPDAPRSGSPARGFTSEGAGYPEEDHETNGDQMNDTVDKATGRVKKAVGDLTGDSSLQREGTKEEKKGEAKDKLEDAQDKVEEKAQDVADLERKT